MILTTLAAIGLLSPALGAPVKLNRTFIKGEKLRYDVKSTINAEARQLGLETWMPEDFDIQYQFTTEVVEMKADGIADLKYLRPTTTEIAGETAARPPQKKIDKTNLDMLLTVTPVNEILKIKDLAKKDPPAKPAAKPKPPVRWIVPETGLPPQDTLSQILGTFVGEIYRLSLFLGPLDSSLDFSPKLPFDEVEVGETWKRTAGYSPQKLQGKGDKLAVQRMDYTYTYVGVLESQGKTVHRITADIELKTDLAEFVHQTYGVKSDVTGLKEIPLEFKGKLEFDLELKSHRTLRAFGTSEGGYKVMVVQLPNQPVQEEKFKGRTILKLVNP